MPKEEKITQYALTESITKENIIDFVEKYHEDALKPLDEKKPADNSKTADISKS